MKYKHLFWGIFLIAIGILWLLKSINIVHFSWYEMLHLWPLALVWIGITLIPMKDIYKIIADMVVLIIGIILLLTPFSCCSAGTEESSNTIVQYQVHKIMNDDTGSLQRASLSFTAGAGKFSIKPGSDIAAVEGVDKGHFTTNIRNDEEENKTVVNIEQNNIKKLKTPLTYDIMLNTDPVWDLDLELGAVKGELDLSNFRVEEIDIEAGASSIDLTISNLHPTVHISISTGASSVSIAIPKSMNCTIENESALSSTNYEGFIKKSKGIYESMVGEEAGTVNIEIESGVSSFNISRY